VRLRSATEKPHPAAALPPSYPRVRPGEDVLQEGGVRGSPRLERSVSPTARHTVLSPRGRTVLNPRSSSIFPTARHTVLSPRGRTVLNPRSSSISPTARHTVLSPRGQTVLTPALIESSSGL
jgi:hypothetical protein